MNEILAHWIKMNRRYAGTYSSRPLMKDIINREYEFMPINLHEQRIDIKCYQANNDSNIDTRQYAFVNKLDLLDFITQHKNICAANVTININCTISCKILFKNCNKDNSDEIYFVLWLYMLCRNFIMIYEKEKKHLIYNNIDISIIYATIGKACDYLREYNVDINCYRKGGYILPIISLTNDIMQVEIKNEYDLLCALLIEKLHIYNDYYMIMYSD